MSEDTHTDPIPLIVVQGLMSEGKSALINRLLQNHCRLLSARGEATLQIQIIYLNPVKADLPRSVEIDGELDRPGAYVLGEESLYPLQTESCLKQGSRPIVVVTEPWDDGRVSQSEFTMESTSFRPRFRAMIIDTPGIKHSGRI